MEWNGREITAKEKRDELKERKGKEEEKRSVKEFKK